MRLIIVFASILASSTLLSTAAAQPNAEATPKAIEAHVRFLADDLLEGRDNGTIGYEIAAGYVAAQLLAMGVEPGNGDDWYQQVPFVQRGSPEDKPASLSIAGRTLSADEALIYIRQEAAVHWAGDIVFAGYGMKNPRTGVDDLRGLDIRGKLVAYLPDPPFEGVRQGDVEARLAALGAAGVLELPALEPNKRFQWDGIRLDTASLEIDDGSLLTRRAAFKAWLDIGQTNALFSKAPRTFAAVLEALSKGESVKGFALNVSATIEGSRRWQRSTSPNIVGRIEGSDPKLKHEVVVLMAHLDHLGRKASTAENDNIFNGALDNAAGVAVLLETARKLAQGHRPKRTILFAAVTAEEDGLLGSEYLATHFPAKLGKPVAVVNLDMPLLTYDFTDIVAFGEEHSEMGRIASGSAAELGIRVSPDPIPEEGAFFRSDHYSFVKKGVPGLLLMPGFANGGEPRFREFLKDHYHKPSDDLRLPFDWAAGAKFAQLNCRIVQAIANAPNAPRWYETSELGRQFALQSEKKR